jgi:dolichol-phosphate mannosyltransferase
VADRTLSIVMPAYNESAFIGTLIERIRSVDLSSRGFAAEILVVDDGSNDDTAAIAERFEGVRVWRQERNQGKGAAVRRGIELSTGDALIIQDADLEYDPEDYLPMLEALEREGVDAVYGSRYLRPGLPRGPLGWIRARHREQSFAAYWGGRSLSLVAWATTGLRITDTVTALKLFPRELIQSLPLETTGFELDHEISARLAARGCTIVEVPIGYSPRSKAEGKKIGFRDWLRALRSFWRYRRG